MSWLDRVMLAMTIEANKEKDIKLKVVAGATRGPVSIMEVVSYAKDGARLSQKYINVAELKAKGVIKRSNSYGKAETWLNTPEGKVFYDEAEHCELF